MRVLDQLAALGGAFATRLSALLHMFVIGKLGARIGAHIARLGARVGNHRLERAVPSTNGGANAANRGAVLAKSHRVDMILLASNHEFLAMMAARLTIEDASHAGLGARVVVVVMFACFLPRLLGLGCRHGACRRGRGSQRSQNFSAIHIVLQSTFAIGT